MSTFFTDVFCQALKAAPTMMNGSTLKMYLFPTAAQFEPNDSRYVGLTTVAQLVNQLGWGNYLTPSPANFTVGTVDEGNNRYVFADNPVMMNAAWNDSMVSAIAFEYVSPNVGMANKLAFVTNRPLPSVINTQDGITAQFDGFETGHREFFGWSVPGAASGTAAQPVEGQIVVFRGPPDFEPARTQHVWMFPQRVNLIANPSFENDVDFWRSNGTFSRVSGYAPGIGGGSFYGKLTSGSTPAILESNIFPLRIRKEIPEGWTIQFQARGNGALKVGLVTWPATYEETLVDWGPPEEEWILSDTWRKVRSLRRIADVSYGMLRLETSGTYLDIDHVCTEPGFLPENLNDWEYFDGDTIFGGEGDYTWYGNEPHASYSCWVNHRSGVMSRLYAWDVVKGATPDVITDEEARQQGLVYQWVPAGTPVTQHQDVLYVGDPRTPPLGVVGDPLDLSSPWDYSIDITATVTVRDHPHMDEVVGIPIIATVTGTDISEPPEFDPFPTEDTAGVPPGWTPVTTLGSTTITVNGTTVEDTLFNGSVTVNADNVTIRNCKIVDGFINNWAGAMIRGPLLIENVSMIRTPEDADESDPPAITAGNYTARNVKIVDYAEGFRASGDVSEGGGPILIEDCWVRCIEPPGAADWHGDGLQAYGDFEGTTIRNSYLYLDPSGTSAIFYPDQFNSNLVLDRVIAEGGGWTVVLGKPSQVTSLYVVDDSWGFGPVDNIVDPYPFTGWTCTLDGAGQPVIVAPIVL